MNNNMKAKLHKMVSGYILSLNGDIDDPYAIVNEELAKDYEWHKLSLKNCQAIELGYDLDGLISESDTSHLARWTSDSHELMFDEGFKIGFQKALELMGDKKFSEEDINTAYSTGYEDGKRNENFWGQLIQSLQQTEWEVEVYTVPALSNNGNVYYGDIPKLDENGCLILKRI